MNSLPDLNPTSIPVLSTMMSGLCASEKTLDKASSWVLLLASKTAGI